MPFKLNVSNQSKISENYLKANMYYKLHDASKKKWIRLTGLGRNSIWPFDRLNKNSTDCRKFD